MEAPARWGPLHQCWRAVCCASEPGRRRRKRGRGGSGVGGSGTFKGAGRGGRRHVQGLRAAGTNLLTVEVPQTQFIDSVRAPSLRTGTRFHRCSSWTDVLRLRGAVQ